MNTTLFLSISQSEPWRQALGHLRIATVLLTLALIASCGPVVEGLYRNPGFGLPSISQGGLLVAGVGSAPYPLPAGEANRLAEELRMALQEHVPGSPILPAGQVAMTMGQPAYELMLANLSATGRAAPTEVALLGRKFPGVRYAAFGRVDEDRTSHHRDRNEEPIYQVDKKGKSTGKVLHYEIVDTFSATREVAVQVTVIEIATGQVMWSGRTRRSGSRENQLQAVRLPGWAGFGVSGWGQHQYPEPPDSDRLLAQALREAAQAMTAEP